MQADVDTKDMTFLAEYTGDVDFLESRANDNCDSIMTLLSAADPSKKLVICPDKRGNIARFINGINNHTPDGNNKQNVKCVRYNIDGLVAKMEERSHTKLAMKKISRPMRGDNLNQVRKLAQ